MKTSKKILELLKSGIHTQKELAERTGRSRAAIAKAIERLIKRGIVKGHGTTTNRYFELTTQLSTSLTTQLSTLSKAASSKAHTIKKQPNSLASSQAETYRQHAIWVEVQIEQANTSKAEMQARKQGIRTAGWAMQNNYVGFLPDLKGFEVYIYPHILKIVPPDNEQPQDKAILTLLQQQTLRKVYSLLPAIERATGVKITQTSANQPILYVVREEIAQTRNKLAKEVIRDRKRIKIEHPGTKDICYVIDASKEELTGSSMDESEATLPATNPHHTEATKTMYHEVLHNGAWDALKDDHAKLHQLIGAVDKLAQNITVHIPYWEATTEYMNWLMYQGRKPSKKAFRKFLAGEEPKQKRLFQ